MAQLAELHRWSVELDSVNDEKELISTANKLATAIQELPIGESLVIPGGWKPEKSLGERESGHAMLYQVVKTAKNLYTFRVINTGGGLTLAHDFITVATKTKYKPVVEYSNIPSDKLFLSLGLCEKSYFFYALLEPNVPVKQNDSTRPKYDAEYVYNHVLRYLEKYRSLTSNQLSGFISAQRSGTCSWKVNNALLRMWLPLPLYKKIVAVIKFNTLLGSWIAAEDSWKEDRMAAGQMRELFSKSARQLDRRLAKAYAKLEPDQTLFKEWIIKAAATTFELLDYLSVYQKKILVERKLSFKPRETASVNAAELTNRAITIAAIGVDSPKVRLTGHSPHYSLKSFEKNSAIVISLIPIFKNLLILEGLVGNKQADLSVIRAQVEMLMAELPLPALGDNDLFWDKVDHPFHLLSNLALIADIYTNAVITPNGSPTFNEIATFLTLYTIIHRLTVRVETEHVAESKKSGKGASPLFQNYGIFNPAKYFNADRYLSCDDPKVLKRMEQLLGYLQEWNQSKTGHSSPDNDSLLYISFSTEISQENVETRAEFQFYDKLIVQEEFEELLDHLIETGTSENAKVAREAKVSNKIKRIALLLNLIDLDPDFFCNDFHDSLHSMSKVAFLSWLYVGSHTFEKLDKRFYQSKNLKAALTANEIVISYYYRNGSQYFKEYTIGQAGKALLPPLQKNCSDFVDNTKLNTHQIEQIPLPSAEATALMHESKGQDEESHLFRLLEQSAAEPYLQPNKILYAFNRHLNELGGHSHSVSYQALFFTLFFKTFNSTKEMLISPVLNLLETQVSLRRQAAQFIEQGLNYFWYLQPRKKAMLEACLFFVQLAQRIRLTRYEGEEFLSDLERNTLDIWVKESEFTNTELANVHLHRIHGYCGKEFDELSSEDLINIASSWVFWQQNPVEASHRWPEIQHRVESFFHRLIAHFTIKDQNDALKLSLSDETMRRMGEESLEFFGIQLKNEPQLWKCHSQYRIVVFNHQTSGQWVVDLVSGEIFNESGVRKDAKEPTWIFNPTYKRLFGSRRHNYQDTGQALYFTDQLLGAMRFLSIKGKNSLEHGLQCSIKGEWCQYLSPISLADELPRSLLVTTHLWKSPQGTVWICSRQDNSPIGQIDLSGAVMIDQAHHLEGAHADEEPLEIRRQTLITSIDRLDYSELRCRQGQPVQLAFPRYRSTSKQPLVFDVVGTSYYLRHDTRFFIAAKQQNYLLPALMGNNYLVLTNSKERKLIVPCQRFAETTDLSPDVLLGLDVSDSRRKEKWQTVDFELDDEQIGVYRYLEYELTEDGDLIAARSEEQLYLAYLHLQARDYASSLACINKVEKIDTLSTLSLEILQSIFELSITNHDTSPSATAIQLHALLKRWPSHQNYLQKLNKTLSEEKKQEFDKIYKAELENILKIYKRYLSSLSNVASAVELYVEQELVLIELLAELKDNLLAGRHQFIMKGESAKSYLNSPVYIYKGSPSNPTVVLSQIAISTEAERLEDQLHFPEMSPKSEQEDFADCWPSIRSSDCFFWKMAQICQKMPSEALRLKLSLLKSVPNSAEEVENNLLHFIFTVRPRIDSRPDNSASLKEKQLWYKALVEKFNEANKSGNGIPSLHHSPSNLIKETAITPVMPPQLKLFSWQDRTNAGDLMYHQLNSIDFAKQARQDLYVHFLTAQSPQAKDDDPPFSLIFDPKAAPKEEEAYANAIAGEYRDFLNDLEAGKEQALSQKHWKLSSGNDSYALSQALTAKQKQLHGSLAKIEAEILTLANIKPTGLHDYFRSTLHEYAGLRDPLLLSDLVLLFLKRSRTLFEMANPTLKGLQIENQEAISLLYRGIGDYLHLAIEIQAIERALDLCKKIMQSYNKLTDDYHLQLMAQELIAECHYIPTEHPEYLVFEYCSNIRLRQKQVDLLAQLLRQDSSSKHYFNSVVQLIMGGGKTSVLASILCHLAAKPDRLSLFITPSSQYETVKENLKVTQRRCFNQSILPLDFRREELSVEFIEAMLERIRKAMQQGEMALMRVESLQMLELEFIASLRNAKASRKRAALSELLLLLRHQADALIDEVDQVLNGLQTVNFPEGSCQRVPAEQIELTREIYAILSSNAIHVENEQKKLLTMREYVGLPDNRQTLLTSKEIMEIIAPVVAGQLARHHQPLMLADYVDSFVRYVSGKMSEPNPTEEQRNRDKEFLLYLKSLYESKNPQEIEAANMGALAKHIVRTLLPITFAKSGGRQYGRTRTTPAGKAVPFLAVDTPATTEFGYHYEALAYQFQTALQFGVSKEQILQLASNMRKVADHHVRLRRINFDDTAEAKEFLAIASVSLSTITAPGNVEKAVLFINQDVDKVLRLEASTSVETVTYHSERIESTAQSVICQVSTCRAFSATPWNSEGYHPLLSDRLIPDLGTEGQIAYTLLERMRGQKQLIHTAHTEDPGLILRTIIQNHREPERIRGLMDPGGLFKKSDNERVARALLAVLQESRPEIKGILFFYRPAGKETADTLALLKVELSEPILIEGTNVEAIRKTGLAVEDYFVYYDERHTSGTDILQIPSAINLVTVDETLLRRNLFQAVLRLRQFFFHQTVEFVIPAAAKKRIVANGETIEGILESAIKNQAIHKSKYLFRCFKQMLENTLRQSALNHLFLLAKQKDDLSKEFNTYKPFLVGENNNLPYEAFGRLDREVSSIESLELYKKELCKRWLEQGLDIQPLEAYLEAIIGRARKSTSLQIFILEPGSETIGIEQEINIQVEYKVENEVRETLEQELQQELQHYEQVEGGEVKDEAAWTDEQWEALITALQRGESETDGLPTAVKPLKELLETSSEDIFSYPKPYHLIFKNLLATGHYVSPLENRLPLFHRAFRPADHLLVVTTSKGLTALLLSSYEAHQLKQWMLERGGDTLLSEVWLVQPDGSLWVDNPLSALPLTNPMKDLLLIVNALNGNADYMDRNPQDTLRWLSANNAEIGGGQGLRTKIDYLKMKVARNQMQWRIFENSRTLQPEKVASGTFQGVQYLGRAKHNRLADLQPEKVAFITDSDRLQTLPDELVRYVTPQQVPHLLVTQHRLLSTCEQLAAIPLDNFVLEMMHPDQVRWFADWQVKKISGRGAFLNKLVDDQVNLIPPNLVNTLSEKQIGWITDPALLHQLSEANVRHVNPSQAAQLKKEQLQHLEGEQIGGLNLDILEQLSDEQLEQVTAEQIEKAKASPLADRLQVISERIAKMTLQGILKVNRIAHLHMKLLNEETLKTLARSQVQQFNVLFIDRLPDERLADLSKAQLKKIDAKRKELIQRLPTRQIVWLQDEALAEISTNQLQKLDVQKEMARLSDERLSELTTGQIESISEQALIHRLSKKQFVQLKKNSFQQISVDQIKQLETAEEMLRLPKERCKYLTADQLGNVDSFQLFTYLPVEQIAQMPVWTVFQTSPESLDDLSSERIKSCSFMQAVALSIYYLAIGIFWTLKDLVLLYAALPFLCAGYSIADEVRNVGRSVSYILRGLVTWSMPFWPASDPEPE